MTYACDPSTQETDVGHTQDQPGLPTRTLSQKLSTALIMVPRQFNQKGTISSTNEQQYERVSKTKK